MTTIQNKKTAGQTTGHLVIIGGKEDREHDKAVLSRFIDLAGGEQAKIVVLTAASRHHTEMWDIYDQAFADLGVRERTAIAIESREDAFDSTRAEKIFNADGIFITGGDQRRLLALIGGTKIDQAIHQAFQQKGTCIGGTSAGASAMSEHMLAEGEASVHPQKGLVYVSAGLGFMPRVVIDQHFSERQRLGRLLSVVAQNPYLIGIGIDEDTALVVAQQSGIEVIGNGAITLLDGRHMSSNLIDIKKEEHLQLVNVKLHLLPAGIQYYTDRETLDCENKTPKKEIPASLQEIISIITEIQ